MKEEKTKIAKNTSSGAEKVERIQKSKTQKGNEVKTVKKVKAPEEETAVAEAALGSGEQEINAKKMNATLSKSKAEKESKAAKKRVQTALDKKKEKAKKKEEKKKKIAEKKAAFTKKVAEKKAEIAKKVAERKALAEKRKAERAEKAKERAHAKANKNLQKQKTQKSKQGNRNKSQKKERRSQEHGYGGWLAAVISLGAVTLALTTAVTVGAIDMSRTKKGVASSHRSNMYELTGIMEHVDNDLDRVRISASPNQQSRILTDLLVQARLAEQDLEKIPLSAERERNITTFLNRTAHACEEMLAKLRRGEGLTSADMEKLEGLYQTNHTIRTELDKLMEKMTDKDLMTLIKKGAGSIADTLKNLEQVTLEENRAAFDGAKEEMGKRKRKQGEDTENKDGATSIEPAKAEELCSQYFSDYPIAQFQCIGETVSFGYSAYNVQGYDDKGTLLFAEIDQNGGELLRFDYYEDCKKETFDLENAKRIAEEFLQKLGYEDMEAVRVRESGTTTDFTYVYSDEGVAYYPDEVRVKVCRTRGVVTGLDATKYMKNHIERMEPTVKISLAEAREKLYEGLDVQAARLTVVKTARGDMAAYEFLCNYQEEQYFVYLSASTGEEISILNVKSVS